MESLTFRIYRERNKTERDETKSAQGRSSPNFKSSESDSVPDQVTFCSTYNKSRELYSTFRKKSIILPSTTDDEEEEQQEQESELAISSQSERRQQLRTLSLGTLPPPEPQQLKVLVKESGIWDAVLHRAENDRAFQIDSNQANTISSQSFHVLETALVDVLSIDKQHPSQFTQMPHATHSHFHKSLINKSFPQNRTEEVQHSRPNDLTENVKRTKSAESYQTMLSEITYLSFPTEEKEILPIKPQPDDSIVLKINPRAPQYQIALDQQEKLNNDSNSMILTEKIENRLSEYQRINIPSPPRRTETPGEEGLPNIDSSTFNDDGNEVPMNSGVSKVMALSPSPRLSNLSHPLEDDSESEASLEDITHNVPGPFTSDELVSRNSRLSDMQNPQQHSNPQLYPANLMEDSKGPQSSEPLTRPEFLSTSSQVRRRLSRKTFSYPRGLDHFPVSPRNHRTTQRNTIVNSQDIVLEMGIEEKKFHPNLNLEHLFDNKPKESEFTKAKDPADSDWIEKKNSLMSVQTAKQMQSKNGIEKETGITFRSDFDGGLRVKMCPSHIVYVVEGKTHLHRGHYSGSLNVNLRMEGNGIFWFSSGDVYLGEFMNGQFHGAGIMSISVGKNKQILQGQFRCNEYMGERVLID